MSEKIEMFLVAAAFAVLVLAVSLLFLLFSYSPVAFAPVP